MADLVVCDDYERLVSMATGGTSDIEQLVLRRCRILCIRPMLRSCLLKRRQFTCVLMQLLRTNTLNTHP